jgi:hypothetical protein
MVHSRRKIRSAVGVGDFLSFCIFEGSNHSVVCVGYGPRANPSSLVQNAGQESSALRIVDG